jgi:chromosome segregation ATPase
MSKIIVSQKAKIDVAMKEDTRSNGAPELTAVVKEQSVRIDDLESLVKELTAKLDDELRNVYEDVDQLRLGVEEIYELKSDVEEVKDDVGEIKASVEDMKVEASETDHQLCEMKEQIDQSKYDIMELTDDLNEVTNKQEENDIAIKDLQSDVEELKDGIGSMTIKLEEAIEGLQVANEQVHSLKWQCEGIRCCNASIQDIRSSLQQKIEGVYSMIDKVQADTDQSFKMAREARGAVDSTKDSVAGAHARIDLLQNDVKEINDACEKQYHDEVFALTKQIEELQRDLHQVKSTLQEDKLDQQIFNDSLFIEMDKINETLSTAINKIPRNNGNLFESGQEYIEYLLEDNATALKKDGIHREKLKEAIKKEQREWDEYKAIQESGKRKRGGQRKNCDVELRKLSSYVENGKEGEYLPDAIEEKLLSIVEKDRKLRGKEAITLCVWTGIDLKAEMEESIEFRQVGKELTNGEKKLYCYDKETKAGMFSLFY